MNVLVLHLSEIWSLEVSEKWKTKLTYFTETFNKVKNRPSGWSKKYLK